MGLIDLDNLDLAAGKDFPPCDKFLQIRTQQGQINWLAQAVDEINEAAGSGDELKPATTTTLGGVIVGDGLDVDENGVLSSNVEPVATVTVDPAIDMFTQEGTVIRSKLTPGMGIAETNDGMALSLAHYSMVIPQSKLTWESLNSSLSYATGYVLTPVKAQGQYYIPLQLRTDTPENTTALKALVCISRVIINEDDTFMILADLGAGNMSSLTGFNWVLDYTLSGQAGIV